MHKSPDMHSSSASIRQVPEALSCQLVDFEVHRKLSVWFNVIMIRHAPFIPQDQGQPLFSTHVLEHHQQEP